MQVQLETSFSYHKISEILMQESYNFVSWVRRQLWNPGVGANCLQSGILRSQEKQSKISTKKPKPTSPKPNTKTHIKAPKAAVSIVLNLSFFLLL